MAYAHRVAGVVVGSMVSVMGALAAPAPAAAQPRLEGEAGLFGGAHLFSKKLELGEYDDPGNTTSPTNGATIGLRLALTLRPWVSLEAEAAGIPTQDRRDQMTAFVAYYRAHALVHLLHGRLRPFVLAGAGAMHLASTNAEPGRGLGVDVDAAVHVGVGTKYALWDGLSARLDVRAVGLPSNEEFGITTDWEILAGITYRFDLTRDPAPAPRPTPVAKTPPPAPPKPAAPPPAAAKDEDGDGLTGAADKCPNQAEDKDSFEDEDGCPDPDNDGDGIPDAADKCIDKLESPNGFQDDDGCPDDAPAAAKVEAKETPTVLKGITFASGSATIDARSRETLDATVKTLKEDTSIRIEVAGHTSNDGTPEANLALSKKRADSVKAYLVRAGIDAGRIETVGHGSEKPLAPNITRRGREQNRRIEIRVLK